MTPEQLEQMRIEQEKAQKRAELEALMGQVKAVQSMATELQSTISNIKGDLEQVLLIDNRIYKEELVGKLTSNSGAVASNLSNAVGIIQAEISSL